MGLTIPILRICLNHLKEKDTIYLGDVVDGDLKSVMMTSLFDSIQIYKGTGKVEFIFQEQ